MIKPLAQNTLFYGDNLPIIREHLAEESVDLIYLDPPFNSQRVYNVSLRDEGGTEADAQIQAFKDFWRWEESAELFAQLRETAPAAVVTLMAALREIVGTTPMLAYLTMMTARLLELRRVLKPTGSLYLHCDPTASHYLKIVLDTIFGEQNFRNEIIWKRTSAHSSAKRYGPVHDVIFFYTKSASYTWNRIYTPHNKDYIEKFYRHVDEQGRRYTLSDLTAAGKRKGSSGQPWRGIDVAEKGTHWKFTLENLEKLDIEGRIYWPAAGGMPRYIRYLDEVPGIALQDVITDIPPLGAQAAERLGYPTQKPLGLLERILQASSNEGDVILDPFCGCGTAVIAAEKLKRKWIGIDITHLSIALMKYRLHDSFNLMPGEQFHILGEPQDMASARQLAQDDRYQFQFWALSLIGARPIGGEMGSSKKGKKGADKGIDGYLFFVDTLSESTAKVAVQVKSGHVQRGMIAQLRGDMERDNAPLAVFITLEAPTREMLHEAANAGFYTSPLWQKQYPRLQILTIEELLTGKTPNIPPLRSAFKQAERIKKQNGQQGQFNL